MAEKCCEFCGFEPVKTQKYERLGRENRDWWLCDLCAAAVGNVGYPRDDDNLMGAILYVGNAVLKELRRGKRA